MYLGQSFEGGSRSSCNSRKRWHEAEPSPTRVTTVFVLGAYTDDAEEEVDEGGNTEVERGERVLIDGDTVGEETEVRKGVHSIGFVWKPVQSREFGIFEYGSLDDGVRTLFSKEEIDSETGDDGDRMTPSFRKSTDEDSERPIRVILRRLKVEDGEDCGEEADMGDRTLGD